MKPTGASKPLIYCTGEAPGADEDLKGIQFVGKAGRVLRFRIPERFNSLIRWNNVVRTRPPGNRNPTEVELEACRPSVVRDIEETQPRAIFGFGNFPLLWALNQTGITRWTGRKIPIQVGDHSAWFFPFLHPSYVLRSRKFQPSDTTQYGSDEEFVFACDLARAFDQVENLPEPVVHSRDDAYADVEWVTGHNGSEDINQIRRTLEQANECKIVGLDYETPCLRPYAENAKILTTAVSTKFGTLAFPLDHPKAGWSDKERSVVHELFQTFLYQCPARKLVHGLAFEMEWSAFFYGSEVLRAGLWGDSQSQAYFLDTRPGCHSLDFITLQHFGLHLKELSNIDRTKTEQYPLEEILPYNGLDSKYHRLNYIEQAKRIRDEGLSEVYEHQLRRIPTLVLTQLKGVPVDQNAVEGFFKKYTKKLGTIEEKIFALKCVATFKKQKGKAFRPGSNPDVLHMITRILGHKAKNVDEEALSKIDHPFCKLILDFRTTAKMISTYIKPYQVGSPDLWPDGLIHPIISTTKVRTWRTASQAPNAQNQPKHGKEKELRAQVSGGSDIKVVSFDFAGIQARNVAMESKDKALVKAFWNRYDIHKDWAERLIRIYPQWVTEGVKALKDKDIFKAYRQRAKNEFVFASFFGAQPPKLSRALRVPEPIALKLSKQFWDEFPDIKGWHEFQRDFYYENGYITGLSGFRRYAPVSPTEMINSPIQADESIIVLDAMERLSELEDDRFQANLEVHDDLTFLWPKKEIERNSEVVLREMLRVTFDWVIVPLEVEMSVGDNWSDMHEIGKFESIKSGGFREIK
jgi:uracil-DNA glycosylase family 4